MKNSKLFLRRLAPIILLALFACGPAQAGLGTFDKAEKEGLNPLLLAALSGTSSTGCSPNFQTTTAAEANGWESVTYGNGLYVAVATTGANRVMTSPDGINWTARAASEANSWYGLAYGNGMFVAVSLDGTNRVMTSPDGINWTARAAAQQNIWGSVTYGNGKFVAVAANGTNRVMTSPDGITWTAQTQAANSGWSTITYGNGLFVALSGASANSVMTSPDGVTWTAHASTDSAALWRGIAYGNGRFVGIADQSGATQTNHLMYSTDDGTSWTAGTAVAISFWPITFASGMFVSLSDLTNFAMTSTDGVQWRSLAQPSGGWRSIAYANGRFVAVAAGGTNRAMRWDCP